MIAITPEMLGQAAASVLADAAFVLLEPAPAEVSWPTEMLIAEIPFGGATPGRLILAASEPLMVTATADLLRLEYDDPLAEESAPATLAELANVLLGTLARRFFEPEPSWDMGLPATRRGIWLENEPDVRCSTVLVDAERRPVAVALTIPPARPR